MRFFPNSPASVGNTPLVRLARVAPKAMLLAKLEGRNPSFSVKCRVGVAMIEDAEGKGLLKPGMEIIEPTSGNTGIALAATAAAKGYRITLAMPDTMSVERRKVLSALGAHLLLTRGEEGIAASIRAAKKLVAENPGRYFMPDQFANPANPAILEATTGPEIWRDTDGAVDVFVSTVGSGGTFTGVTRFLKTRKAITAIAVEPAESAVITQTRNGQPLNAGAHGIQGIGAGFIPGNLDLALVDRVEAVATAEAIAMARRLAQEEGILCGISSGAAVAAALRLAHDPAFAGKTLVTILPDLGERYLSTELFASI